MTNWKKRNTFVTQNNISTYDLYTETTVDDTCLWGTQQTNCIIFSLVRPRVSSPQSTVVEVSTLPIIAQMLFQFYKVYFHFFRIYLYIRYNINILIYLCLYVHFVTNLAKIRSLNKFLIKEALDSFSNIFAFICYDTNRLIEYLERRLTNE